MLRRGAFGWLVTTMASGCIVDADPNEFGAPQSGPASAGSDDGAEHEDEHESGAEEASSGGAEAGSGAEVSSSGSTGGADGDDAGSTAAISDDDGADTASATTGGAVTSDGVGSDDSGGGTAGVADGGPYSACQTTSECDMGLGCLTIGDGVHGFCSPTCGGGTPDATLCPDPPPGVTAMKICVAGLFANSCALDCAGGDTCPEGTACMMSEGATMFCFGE